MRLSKKFARNERVFYKSAQFLVQSIAIECAGFTFQSAEDNHE